MSTQRREAPDAGTLLMRALRSMAAAAGCVVHIESIGDRPWASATFVGMRHVVVLANTAVGDDAIPVFRSWLVGLPEAEFALRGHMVVDLNVDSVDDDRATLTVLTLADA